jgi:photosystem II stability/assembly factor-like uncharacterized protein
LQLAASSTFIAASNKTATASLNFAGIAVRLFALIHLLIGIVGFVHVLPLYGQHQPNVYNLHGPKWRSVGPNRGGRSLAVAGSAARPFEYYFGATGGGLWKTLDGGNTWAPVTDKQINSSSVGALAVSESNPDVVYIGMGESELRGGVIQGDGVYKSVDGGRIWSHVGLERTQVISRIRIDPTNPEIVYVAALGHPYGPNEERGVFRSKDGGKSWRKILFRNDRAGAIDLSIDARNPQVIFATLWEVYRTPWTLSSGGLASGLFKSVDGGDTWAEITHNEGLPKGLIGKINISISGADPNRVYVSVEAADGGFFRSDDAGANWTKINEDRNIRQRAFYFNRVQADTRSRDTVYIMNVELYKSIDGGKTLVRINTPHADHHDLWIAPGDSERMIEADDGGGAVSVNGGKTWTQEQYSTGQFYHVATTRDIPYDVCGAQQDEGAVCVPSGREPGPEAPTARFGDPAYAIAGGEAGYVVSDPTDNNVSYAGDQAGVLVRYDRATGQTRDVQVDPWFFSGMPAKELKERWQWVFPIVFSPIDPHALYASSQYLWKTINDGQSWKRISPDLTRADPSTLGDSGGPITKDQNGPEIYGTIFAVAPSHFDTLTIWTGSDDGLAYITRDGGVKWENITPLDLPKFSRISVIEASPNKAGTAYLAANRYEMDDRSPYIFKTDNYGKAWTKIVDGISRDDFARGVREDPKRPGLLYAGTEHGMYVSFSDGAYWQSLSLNLPDTQVSDLVVEGDDLVISTFGRSFYVLQNITALRELNPSVSESEAYLFEPRVAVRPIRDAEIDYFLQQPENKVTIKILESSGKTVQSFSNGLDPGKVIGPGVEAGLNRFVWNLRYPGATVFDGIILRGASPELGPVAVPGEYEVQLTVKGKTRSQRLTIVKDPRLKNVTEEDLQAQFKLATEARDGTSQADEMVIRIREIKKQIQLRVNNSSDHTLSAASHVLTMKLSSVEEALYQVRNRSPRDTFNYPIRLNNQLAALMEEIETGDERPTDQMYTTLRDLSTELGGLSARMDDVLKHDLSQFNRLLQVNNFEPVQDH